jgi:DNA polymerase III subunit delta'
MDIIGHKKILDRLGKSIKRGNVGQAYIFSGPENVGKYAVALDFAGKLLKDSSPLPDTKRVNPDLIIIEPEIEEKRGVVKKRDIKIEKIRELQRKAGLSASGGTYKVAIINDANRLNKSAQNALLKTLEEPSDNFVMILVAQDEKRILPTIMSRCQRVKFGTVPLPELEKNIPADAKNKDEVLFWSLGRPGLLLELVKKPEEMSFRNESLEELKDLFRSNITEKFSFAEKLSKDTDLAIKKMNFWLIAVRQTLLGEEMGVKISQSGSLRLIEKIEECIGLIKDTNSNARLLLENLFLNFQ